MPEIFSKDCKMTVIEYGSSKPDDTVHVLLQKVSCFFKGMKDKNDKAA